MRPRILVVDDTKANLIAMRRLLSKVDADLVEASSGNEALAACIDQEFAVILLDVNMPEMSGFEVAELLGGDEQTRSTPIVFVTAAYADDLNRLKGYRMGAIDYIAKPINDTILLAKVAVFLELYRSKAQIKASLAQVSALNEELTREVSERKRAEAEAQHRATHDALTGLPNRALFMDRMNTAIERARRRGRPFALSFIDLDGFKPVNDSYGHEAGDALLRAIAERLRLNVRQEDTVARLGGDEFTVIMEDAVDSPAVALRLSQGLCGELRRPFDLEWGGQKATVQIGASLGVAMYAQHGEDCDALVRAADSAMYLAKRNGKNRCVMFGADGSLLEPNAPPVPAAMHGEAR